MGQQFKRFFLTKNVTKKDNDIGKRKESTVSENEREFPQVRRLLLKQLYLLGEASKDATNIELAIMSHMMAEISDLLYKLPRW